MSVNYLWDLVQNTDEWMRARSGIITSSVMGSILTPTLKVASNAGTRSLANQLCVERIYGYLGDNFQSYDMLRGHTEEVYAKELYSEKFAQTKDCGFVTNDELGFLVGFSPDAMVGDDGFVEIKSRKEHLQVETILKGEVPSDYILQIQTGLFVTGRKWCDFISYSNGMPMFVQRVYPDPDTISAIKEACAGFEERIAETIKEFRAASKSLPVAKRRDYESGDVIKPSHSEADSVDPANYLMAG